MKVIIEKLKMRNHKTNRLNILFRCNVFPNKEHFMSERKDRDFKNINKALKYGLKFSKNIEFLRV